MSTSFKAPLQIVPYESLQGHDHPTRYYFIKDSADQVYHHKDKKFRAKRLKDEKTYRYGSYYEAGKVAGLFTASHNERALIEVFEPYFKDVSVEVIMKAVGHYLDLEEEAKEKLTELGYTIIPPTNIIQQSQIDDFLSTLQF